jgi:hypothetical protein
VVVDTSVNRSGWLYEAWLSARFVNHAVRNRRRVGLDGLADIVSC